MLEVVVEKLVFLADNNFLTILNVDIWCGIAYASTLQIVDDIYR